MIEEHYTSLVDSRLLRKGLKYTLVLLLCSAGLLVCALSAFCLWLVHPMSLLGQGLLYFLVYIAFGLTVLLGLMAVYVRFKLR